MSFRGTQAALVGLLLAAVPLHAQPEGPVLRLCERSAGELAAEGIRCRVGDRLLLEVVVRGPAAPDAELGELPRLSALWLKAGRRHEGATPAGFEVLFPLTAYPLREGKVTLPGIPVGIPGGAPVRTAPLQFLVEAAPAPDASASVDVRAHPDRPFENGLLEATLTVRMPSTLLEQGAEGTASIWLPWLDGTGAFGPRSEPARRVVKGFEVRDESSERVVTLEREEALVEGGDGTVLTLERRFLAREPGVHLLAEGFLRWELTATDSKSSGAGGGVAGHTPGFCFVRIPALAVRVRAVPADGRPASWVDAVGDYDLSVWVRPREIAVGEMLTAVIAIEGEGAVETITLPGALDLQAQGFQILRRDERAGAGWRQLILETTPSHEGIEAFPAVEFSFFDPYREQFVTRREGPFPLVVRPRPSGAAEEHRLQEQEAQVAGLVEIEPDLAASPSRPRSAARWILAGGWVSIPVVWVVALGGAVIFRRYRGRRKPQRGIDPGADFGRQLGTIRTLLERGQGRAAAAGLARALEECIGSLQRVEAAGEPEHEAREAGLDRVDRRLDEEARSLLDRLRRAAFAREESQARLIEETLTAAADLVARWQERRGGHRA
ncbi:MAG: hypothetical protein AB1486_23670 [Planctomycetota bacterium]